MAYALDLGVIAAVTDYDSLIAEIRDLIDDAEYSQPRINSAIRKSEAHFNRVLRVPDMETVGSLTLSGDTVPLPADFLEMRAIRPSSRPEGWMTGLSPAALYMTYRGLSGIPEAYAIEGSNLRIAPVGDGGVEILYYAAIPALTSDNQANWLLTKHPDAYISGAMYYLARRDVDPEGQQSALVELNGIIDAIQMAGNNARWGAGPLTPQGIMQVSSRVRA